MENTKDKNIAFIDGQNLYMATSKREVNPWDIDLARFRVYLEQKYHVTKVLNPIKFFFGDYRLMSTSIPHSAFQRILILEWQKGSRGNLKQMR